MTQPKNIEDLIQQARDRANTVEFHQLVDLLEELTLLSKEAQKDPQRVAQLGETYKKFWALFGVVAKQLGVGAETVEKYISRVSQFSPQRWQTTLIAQQQTLGETNKLKSSALKRLMKNKSTRI